MNVGELFLNLGIKGSEKTIGAVANARKGLAETGSVALETKAAIVGVMYALERLVAASGAAGTGLTNFNALTGLSTQTLQQWQYAARQAGESSEELAGSVKGVQAAMTNMLLGKGAPAGLGVLAQRIGFDMSKARDTFYVMQQLQKAAQTLPPDVGNALIKTFGVSDATIAAMRRNAFRPEVFAKAPAYSEKEIAALDRANIAWSNLGQKIQMTIGHLNAKHGQGLVKDMTLMVDSTMKLVTALVELSEKLKVFKAISWTVKELAGALDDISKWTSGKRSFWGEELDKNGKVVGDKSATHSMADFFKAMVMGPEGGNKNGQVNVPEVKPIWDPSYYKSAAQPNVLNTKNVQSVHTTTVKQDLHFQHEGKDAKKTGDSVKQAVQQYVRQSSMQGQGS